jgi:hypothetical protein
MEAIRLSSRLAGRHKGLQTFVYPLIVVLGWSTLAPTVLTDRNWFFLLYWSFFILFLAYKLHSRGKKLRQLYYDQENLYVQEKGQEEIIPLWQVRNVTLTSLNGGYRIDLNKAASAHDYILFLPSFWYPLNFKKQDARVERFQQAILAAKKTYSGDLPGYSLPSTASQL